jgi:ankyrin repeat protein
MCAIYGAIDTLKITTDNYLTITQDNYDHVSIARILLKSLNAEHQFNDAVNIPQEGHLLKGITPLCLAAYLGKLSMVRCLLEEGANVNAADRNGATALMYAGKWVE